jgi:hypothetical protein
MDPIKTYITPNEYIEFEATENGQAACLLFWSWLSGFEQFGALYQQITGKPASREAYDALRSLPKSEEFSEVVKNHKVYDQVTGDSQPLGTVMAAFLVRLKVPQ